MEPGHVPVPQVTYYSAYRPKSVLMTTTRPGPFMFTVPRLANQMIAEFLPMITETHPLLCRASMPNPLRSVVHRFSEALTDAADIMMLSTPIFGGPANSLFPMIPQISLLVWNAQGAGGSGFLTAIRELIRLHDPKVLALVETRISGRRADQVCANIGFDGSLRVEADGFVGGIWLFWRTADVVINMLSTHSQHLTVEISRRGELPWVLSAIYAAPQAARRLELWRELEIFAVTNRRPWLLLGDFNATTSSDERSSSSDDTRRSSRRFLSWIDKLHLIDLGYSGPKYTWSRGRTMSTYRAARLDRGLCNDSWRTCFPEASVMHLSAPHSDHLPLLLQFNDTQHQPHTDRPFRFQAAWMLHDQFKSFLEESWNKQSSVSASLKQFATDVSEWNKTVFGNIFRRKRRLWAWLLGVRCRLAESPSSYLINLERWLRGELENVLDQEQTLWFQKSRANFYLNGDRNTRYYHLSTVIRRKSNKIETLQREDGVWISDKEELSTHVNQFFTALYTAEPPSPTATPLPLFPPISNSAKDNLEGKFHERDVWEALNAMNPHKAPGLDGFHAVFFQKNWPLVKQQVCSTVLSILNDGELEQGLSDALMVLFPKVDHPE